VKEYRSRSVVVLTPFLWLDSDHAECSYLVQVHKRCSTVQTHLQCSHV